MGKNVAKGHISLKNRQERTSERKYANKVWHVSIKIQKNWHIYQMDKTKHSYKIYIKMLSDSLHL